MVAPMFIYIRIMMQLVGTRYFQSDKLIYYLFFRRRKMLQTAPKAADEIKTIMLMLKLRRYNEPMVKKR